MMKLTNLLIFCAYVGYVHTQNITVQTKFPRQAPFCVSDKNEPELANFKEIFEYHDKDPTKFVPVAPNKEQSPSGLVRNISLSRIYITASNLPATHSYRTFHNYFHIAIISVDGSGGLEGLFVQVIGAPIGVPIGEFVTDFDCGDCKIKSSELQKYTSIIPCSYMPAASYMHPTVVSIGGKSGAPRKFAEAHFNFRYVDYPCYDVTHAQFLIIAVRSFAKKQYEVFYSPLYKVGIEAVGAPYPMYYGWTPQEILCHDKGYSHMANWAGISNQKAKIKYSAEYDECIVTENKAQLLGPGNICKPGPVTCGTEDPAMSASIPTSGQAWTTFRERYSRQLHSGGTDLICMDCGNWEDWTGPDGDWKKPDVVPGVLEKVMVTEIVITRRPIVITYVTNHSCEMRNRYSKDENGSRGTPEDEYCNKGNFDDDLAHRGMTFTKTVLTAHSILLTFTWTVGSNCLIYCARFLKEASFTEKGSGCFGIGKWLWEHIFWTYTCGLTMIFGVFLMAHPDAYDLCMSYNSKTVTDLCNERDGIHRVTGMVAVLIFIMGFLSGWIRPKNTLLRNIIIIYHIVCGYLAKYLGLMNLLTAPQFLDAGGITFLVLNEVTFLIFYGVATFINWKMDSQMKFRVRDRKIIPTPEAIDTFSEPPMKNWRALLFPFFIIAQMLIFCILIFFEFGGQKDDDDIL